MSLYDPPVRFNPGEIEILDNGLAPSAPIYFGYDIEDRLVDTLLHMCRNDVPDNVFFMTDKKISEVWASGLLDKLCAAFPRVQCRLLPNGEAGKNFQTLQTICDDLIEKGISKSSLLVAFGGGSIGNVTGLAAGLVFRGIRFVEVPTTLLHQSDGTLSNKQAINGKFGKNHYGLYHAPILIWTDTRYLMTEPVCSKKAGIVEGIKNALIDQESFMPYLLKAIRNDDQYPPDVMTDLCYKIVLSKRRILKKDATERGYGVVLEYGHTFAHALEWLSRGKLTHGVAVGMGMKIAARLACELGYIEASLVTLHDELLDDKLAFMPDIPDEVNVESLVDIMYYDNKKTGRDIRYVLLEGRGRCRKGEKGDYLSCVDPRTVRFVLDAFFNE